MTKLNGILTQFVLCELRLVENLKTSKSTPNMDILSPKLGFYVKYLQNLVARSAL